MNTRFFLIGALALGVALLLVTLLRTAYLISISKKLVEAAEPYDRRSEVRTRTLLVVGDSTGVGVGAATPEQSVPGRVATYVGATYVENRAVSGAVIKDLPTQIASAELPAYDLILVQIGGNEIVRLRNAERSAKELRQILTSLPPTNRLLIISAGDVGAAPLLPFPVRHLFTRKTLEFHAAFERTFPDSYVNLAKAPGNELFSSRPDTYLAIDKFHPSSAGYELWFNALRSRLGE